MLQSAMLKSIAMLGSLAQRATFNEVSPASIETDSGPLINDRVIHREFDFF